MQTIVLGITGIKATAYVDDVPRIHLDLLVKTVDDKVKATAAALYILGQLLPLSDEDAERLSREAYEFLENPVPRQPHEEVGE